MTQLEPQRESDTFATHKSALVRAAQHAYDAHYRQPYPQPQEGASDALYPDLNAEAGVERPNHGLANALRKACLAPLLAAARSRHGQSGADGLEPADFAFEPPMVLAMQVALLFEVCGRQSDIGFNDDPDAFMEYHTASCEAFAAYAAAAGLEPAAAQVRLSKMVPSMCQ
jgi:hypothetical protein